jgi:Na+-transporting methylmalonyl-CoA/oxaloacetate decarboxylase gamma subunit
MNRNVLIGLVIVVVAGLGFYQFSYVPAQRAAEEAAAEAAAAVKAAEEAAAAAAASGSCLVTSSQRWGTWRKARME